jgi:hypothetical protein
VRIRGYFTKPKGVREQKCLGNTVLERLSAVSSGVLKQMYLNNVFYILKHIQSLNVF